MSDEEPVIITERRGRLGLIILNRPKAINALTLEMIDAMTSALDAWTDDDTIDVVAVRGAGDRGLCSGGDIVTLYHAATSGDFDTAEVFWRREYDLDAQIANYPKPYVALMDGVVMGGGVGISVHASHRVVTERTRVGMPEVTIGYTPDVGSSLILSRAPDELGTFIALTGTPLNATDAIRVGMADSYVASEHLPVLLDQLADGDVDSAVATFRDDAASAPESKLEAERIRNAFDQPDVEAILAHLDSTGDRELLDALGRAAPFSLKLTLRALRRARGFVDIESALAQDLTLSMALVRRPDFREGVRATVIDKDRDPKWQPDSLTAIDESELDAIFERLAPLTNGKDER